MAKHKTMMKKTKSDNQKRAVADALICSANLTGLRLCSNSQTITGRFTERQVVKMIRDFVAADAANMEKPSNKQKNQRWLGRVAQVADAARTHVSGYSEDRRGKFYKFARGLIKKDSAECRAVAVADAAICSSAHEIVRRLTMRNPQFRESIIDGKISLEEFAEIVIVQWKAFNCIP